MSKPKSPQAETPNEVQGRDQFQTPKYGTKLLLPFLEILMAKDNPHPAIWECAAGDGRMAMVLYDAGFIVHNTDIALEYSDDYRLNFLADRLDSRFDAIVTNPPFSLKKKFFDRCRSFNVPFALLIPADYSGWIIKAIQDGAEKIIPTRRIDYITPNNVTKSSSQFHSMWLTWGLGLGRTETFVELTKEMKMDI